MNSAVLTPIALHEAIDLVRDTFLAGARPTLEPVTDGYRLYTACGPHFDFWLWIGVTRDDLKLIENWSGEEDYADWGGLAWVVEGGAYALPDLLNLISESNS